MTHLENGDAAMQRRMLPIVGWGLVWTITLLLALVVGRAGVDKFSDTSGWARAFEHWGYPVWFRLLIGVMETAAVLLLLWPRTAPIGALLVIVVMLGGMGTHIVKDGGHHLTSEIVPLVFSAIILYARRDTLRSWRHGSPVGAAIA